MWDFAALPRYDRKPIPENTENPDVFEVSGRGTLHLSVLIESMRREGFELSVSQPRVICQEIEGELCEPIEDVAIECGEAYTGAVIDKLNQRGASLQDLQNVGGSMARIRYHAPSRALIGYRSQFLTDTRGTGTLHAVFSHYAPQRGMISGRANGVLIALEPCETVTFALHNLQERGELISMPGEMVYAGQIVGIHAKANDLVVNPGKKKQLTNMRASGSDDSLRLTPPKRFSLEEALEFIQNDELVEVTPESIRIRKQILDHSDRKKEEKKGKA